MNKPVLVLDCDGVLINWISRLPLFCISNGIDPTNVLKQFTSPKHIDATELFGIHDVSIAKQLLQRYNLEHGKYMTAYTDAVAHVHALSKKYDIIVLTKFGSSLEHYIARKYNLETYFPKCITELITIDMSTQKSEIMTDIITRHGVPVAFVDDQSEYLEDVKSVHPNVRCIKLNRDCDESDVRSFTELVEIL